MSSNNQLLEILANTDLDGLSNNQLLKLLADNLTSETPISAQPDINLLNIDEASMYDIGVKLNEVISALKASGLVQ